MTTDTQTYDVGDSIDLTASFYVGIGDEAVLTDPSAVVLKVKKPDGTTSSTATSNPSTGVYTATISIDQDGLWYYRFEGTGTAQAAGERAFFVRERIVS